MTPSSSDTPSTTSVPDTAPSTEIPATTETRRNLRANPVVFGVSSVGVVAIALWAILATSNAEATLTSVVTWVSSTFGWFYILTATVAVIFIIWIAAGRSGTVRLGPDHSKPHYGLFSWSAMLFAAGIGVDLLFFAVAEPITQYFDAPMTPELGSRTDLEQIEAARQAVVFTLFHYGITGWALYALMGMAFGFYAYRYNMPLSIRSALYPIFGKRIHGGVGDTVEIAAMLGTVFGVATSLGIGVVQLNYGLNVLFSIPENLTTQIALASLAVGIATISAVSGVDKGIKRLSQINVALALGLMFYVLISGRTAFLFDALITNIGDYVSRFPGMTMDAYPFAAEQEWLSAWTLFFWAWWIAWAPFVGLFLARISRGRTLRQFVVGTMTIPFLFVLMWVSVFGNSALDRILGGDTAFGESAMENPQAGFYDLLSAYPLPYIVMLVATIIGLLLYITSADSAALVMSNFTSRVTSNTADGAPWNRIFWAGATGVLTVAMLMVNGVTTLQMATVVMGLPFAIVIYLIMFGLIKSLRLEAMRQDSSRVALHGAMSRRMTTGAPNWRQRLQRSMSYATIRQAATYVEKVAEPTLREVTEELQNRGADAELVTKPVPDLPANWLDLTVRLGEERNFRYQVYPVAYPVPSYAMRVQLEEDNYFRLEVFDITGSLGYDVLGYTREQLIENVLDLYERHLEFIHMTSGLSGPSDISGDTAPVTEWTEDFHAPARVTTTDSAGTSDEVSGLTEEGR